MEGGKIDWAALKLKLPFEKTEEQKKHRSKLWSAMDNNGNGFLSLAEVDKGIRDALNIDALFNCKPVIIRAFNAAKNSVKSKSKYGDDYIERAEFRLLILYLRQYFEYWQMFASVDENNDRRISLAEFVSAVPQIQAWGVKIDDAEKTFSEIDGNKGGYVLFDEFATWAIKKNLDLEDDDD